MYKPNEREYRSLGTFEPFQEENGLLTIRGIPIVFDTPTVLFEEDGIQYKEIIDRNALLECDMSDFILNRNHGFTDGTVYARTRNGSLTYRITADNVEVQAELDPEDDRHRNLYRDIKQKRVDKMSFSFVIAKDGWRYDAESHTRTVTRIKKLYDVSAVDFPAYNDTSIQTARSFFAEEHAKELKELEELHRRKLLIIKTLI